MSRTSSRTRRTTSTSGTATTEGGDKSPSTAMSACAKKPCRRTASSVCGRDEAGAHGRARPHQVYFLSALFFSAGALGTDFAIDVVGTMMCAYGVPFHITHGPPLVQSVGYASS